MCKVSTIKLQNTINNEKGINKRAQILVCTGRQYVQVRTPISTCILQLGLSHPRSTAGQLTHQRSILHGLEAGVRRSGCQQAGPSRGHRERLPDLPPAPASSRHFLAWGWHSSCVHSVCPVHASVSERISPFHKDTGHIGAALPPAPQ